MKSYLSPTCLVFLFTSTLVAQNSSPRYQIPLGVPFGYLIGAEVKYDNHIYNYRGIAEYEVVDTNADSMTVRFRGRVRGGNYPDPNRDRIAELRSRTSLAIEKGRRDRDYDFGGMAEQQATLVLSRRGELLSKENDAPAPLPFYFGDLRTIVFERLPERVTPSWTVEFPIAVGSEIKPGKPDTSRDNSSTRNRDILLDPLASQFHNLVPTTQYQRFDLRPASKVIQYTMQRASRDRRTRDTSVIVFENRIASVAVKMPFEATGQGRWTVERDTFKPLSLESQTTFRINRDGKLEMAQATLSYKLVSQEELATYHEQQALSAEQSEQRRVANREASAKRVQQRLEQEAKRVPSRKEINDVLEQLASERPSERRGALKFLSEHPLAKRSRPVMQKLNEMAAEDDFFNRSALKDLQAAWGISLAAPR